MAQEARSTGVVRWFNDQKGFGFIQPDDKGEDLFVHQVSIKSDGYRTLHEGDAVEYLIETGKDGKVRAIDVTGPNGAPLQGNSSRRDSYGGSRRGGGGYGFSRNSGGGGGYGGYGGYSGRNGGGRNGFGGGGGGGGCYNCGLPGHLAKECPDGGRSGGGGVGGACYNCGGHGHLARHCLQGGVGVGVGGGGGGGCCFNCGDYGHMAKNCPGESSGGAGARFSNSGGECYTCGNLGHFARDCPNNKNSS